MSERFRLKRRATSDAALLAGIDWSAAAMALSMSSSGTTSSSVGGPTSSVISPLTTGRSPRMPAIS